jgi:hypothetical protein
MAQDPVHQSLLLTAARAMGAKVDKAPAEWTGEVFNAEVLSTAFIKEPLHDTTETCRDWSAPPGSMICRF